MDLYWHSLFLCQLCFTLDTSKNNTKFSNSFWRKYRNMDYCILLSFIFKLCCFHFHGKLLSNFINFLITLPPSFSFSFYLSLLFLFCFLFCFLFFVLFCFLFFVLFCFLFCLNKIIIFFKDSNSLPCTWCRINSRL